MKLAFVGDGNNVAQSLMLTAAAARNGFRARDVREGYEPNPDMVAQAEGLAAVSGASLITSRTIRRRRSTARTRSTPMCGPAWARKHEADAAAEARFAPYQVNDELFGHGAAGRRSSCTACPPSAAKKSPTASWNRERSVVFDQAENRLHAQKALLLMMLTSMLTATREHDL